MSLFQHVPHPRIEQRRTTGPTKVNDLRMKVPGPVGRLNARFGLFITVVVGTMWCAYLFTLLALVSLPAALKSGSKIIIVAWIAQAAASDKRAEETYMDAEAVLHEAMQIQEHLEAQDAAIERILQHLGIPMPPPVTGTAVPETGL